MFDFLTRMGYVQCQVSSTVLLYYCKSCAFLLNLPEAQVEFTTCSNRTVEVCKLSSIVQYITAVGMKIYNPTILPAVQLFRTAR